MSNDPEDPYNPVEVPSGQVAPRLADLLDAVQYQAKEFIITRRGKPVALLTTVPVADGPDAGA